MLRAAVADPDPCILFESRALYQMKGLVEVEAPAELDGRSSTSPVGHRRRLSSTWGAMVHQAIEAADVLSEEGIRAAVLDLRWLAPLDHEAIGALIEGSRGRVLIAHEANLTGGFGGELSAIISETHFDLLDAPVRRVATPECADAICSRASGGPRTRLEVDSHRSARADRRLEVRNRGIAVTVTPSAPESTRTSTRRTPLGTQHCCQRALTDQRWESCPRWP